MALLLVLLVLFASVALEMIATQHHLFSFRLILLCLGSPYQVALRVTTQVPLYLSIKKNQKGWLIMRLPLC